MDMYLIDIILIFFYLLGFLCAPYLYDLFAIKYYINKAKINTK